jgi:urease accessory protein
MRMPARRLGMGMGMGMMTMVITKITITTIITTIITTMCMGTRITITAIAIPRRTRPRMTSGDPERDEGLALLRLLAWMSPSFPTGAFSYSHGLEMAVEDGSVRDATTLRAYVTSVLDHGAGHVDAAFLALALRAWAAEDVVALLNVAERAAAMRGSAELALESSAQGQAFLTTARAAWPHRAIDTGARALAAAALPVAHPIAVAIVGAAWKIAPTALVPAFLHALAANLVSAGVRLVPLGQTDGQRCLAALEPTIRAAAARARAIARAEDILGSAPAIELLSIRHETQYTRLFRS